MKKFMLWIVYWIDQNLSGITSYLSYPEKRQLKLVSLSKKWNCVWSTFPILDFDQMHGFYLDRPCASDTRPENLK